MNDLNRTIYKNIRIADKLILDINVFFMIETGVLKMCSFLN